MCDQSLHKYKMTRDKVHLWAQDSDLFTSSNLTILKVHVSAVHWNSAARAGRRMQYDLSA